MRQALLALLLLAPLPAAAGILVEAALEGMPLRLELGAERSRVLAEVAGKPYLVLLDEDAVWRLDDAVRLVPAAPVGGNEPSSYSLDRWSEGPKVAGYVTGYNVMRRGETVCAEILGVAWMTSFLAPLAAAIGLLQRVEPALRPRDAAEGCGPVPFAAYALQGWPMLAGDRATPIWRVGRIAFDHRVDPSRLRSPLETLPVEAP